jgi:hypothetical protein
MRQLAGCGLAIGIVFALTSPALSRAIAPPPLTQRIAVADVIVLGRVTALEDMDVEAAATPGPGAEKIKYRIALVTVGESLLNNNQKMLKVGFRAPPPGKIGPKYPIPHLESGREYILLLHKHHEGKFLELVSVADAVELVPGGKTDAEIAQVKRCIKIVENPKAALQAKDDADRLLAATMLIQKYRGQPNEKTEAIDAEESKLILKVLGEVKDWGKFDPMTRTNPVILFQQLGLTAKDGWNPPQNTGDYNRDWGSAAQAWLTKHTDSYRIQRFVAK